MVQKHDGSGRRILSSPVVHPCENISLPTLLTSLINQADTIISYKSSFFSSNAKNARETVRLVSNIRIFLEEIWVIGSNIQDSVVLSLSELHLALQKVKYLLEDCSGEGVRMWLLMKSERVANQFRVLTRAIATGLEILPLGSINISSETKELAELITQQARKASFEVCPDDKNAINDVVSILNDFDNRVVPCKSKIKQVLDYLQIKKWSECNEEVRFLNSEIEFQHTTNAEKRRDISLLSSLLGLMSYARCVLFSSIDNKNLTQRHNNDDRGNLLKCISIEDFRCPISLEIMKDPVTVETGHTYDRASILKWFGAGNATCPVTGNTLSSTALVPNLSLKQIIQRYCEENRMQVAVQKQKNRDITWSILAGSLAADVAMKMAASFLYDRLMGGESEERSKAAYEIRLLSKTSVFNRSCLVEAGVVKCLLELLVLCKDGLLQENAIAGLLNLSKHSKGKCAIVDNEGLEVIVEVLKNGLKVEAKQHAAATLFYLASIEEYRKLIGENTEAISVLVDMVMKGSDRGKKNALVAIYGLLMHPGNHRRVLAAGAVPLLLSLLMGCEREDLVTDSLAVLASLAEKPDGAKAVLRCDDLPQIVGILDSATSRATKEHCVCLLLALCINGGMDVLGSLVKSPSLMSSLYSLLTEGTSRASKKASTLIKVLQEFYERSSSGSKAPFVFREQFIHVW